MRNILEFSLVLNGDKKSDVVMPRNEASCIRFTYKIQDPSLRKAEVQDDIPFRSGIFQKTVLSFLNLVMLTVLLFPAFLSAQKDTSIYKVIKIVEANEYTLRVPEAWKKIPQVESVSIDEKFEFTNVGLPFKINDAPLTAFFILRKLTCDSIQTGETFIVSEFLGYPDRVTAAGENYQKEALTIASGETASLFHTRYYRRSKVSNFSRYDLVAYSEKRKAAYMLTITYQYKDPTYMAEADHQFRQYAVRILKSLSLR